MASDPLGKSGGRKTSNKEDGEAALEEGRKNSNAI